MHCSITSQLHCHALSEKEVDEALDWALEALVTIVVGATDWALAEPELLDLEPEAKLEDLPSKL